MIERMMVFGSRLCTCEDASRLLVWVHKVVHVVSGLMTGGPGCGGGCGL